MSFLGKRFFREKNENQQGSMLIELLMSVALAAIIMPFIFKYQQNAVMRAENVVITRQMQDIQSALERYIMENREVLLNTVGKNITRVNLSDLVEYGISADLVENSSGKYQLRVLKSNDVDNKATLQGVIVFQSDDISPLRTREIIALGGDSMGFIEGNRAYGTFGAWHADTVDLGVIASDGIIETTAVNRDNALYLWRVPSDSPSDATMLSGLNLGGHDITNTAFFSAAGAQFDETLTMGATVAKDTIFENRITIDNSFEVSSATVSGTFSADSRTLDVSGTLGLDDTAKFSSLTTDDLWVYNMALGGFSSYTEEDEPVILKVNKSIDMINGRIDAMYVTVGFAGSISPRLVVYNRIEDSINPNYFWDAGLGVANFLDVQFEELNRMAVMAVYEEDGKNTESGQIFGTVSSNRNATASDYMNAISEIQNKVTAKYRRLNLE